MIFHTEGKSTKKDLEEFNFSDNKLCFETFDKVKYSSVYFFPKSQIQKFTKWYI